jgi:hypothetical protein
VVRSNEVLMALTLGAMLKKSNGFRVIIAHRLAVLYARAKVANFG